MLCTRVVQNLAGRLPFVATSKLHHLASSMMLASKVEQNAVEMCMLSTDKQPPQPKADMHCLPSVQAKT